MQLDVHLVSPGGGELVRDSAESRLEILSDRDELHATWTRFAAHLGGAAPHVHLEHNDLFYVLDGEFTVLVGREEHAIGPGTLVLAPPLVVHGFRNAGDAEMRYLNFHAPGGGFAPYIRGEQPGFDSYDPPEDGGRNPADAVLGTGEVLADRDGLRIALLCDVDEIAVVEVASTPGGPAPTPPLHVHERHVHTPSRGFGDFTRAIVAARDEDELAAARAAFDQRPA